MSTLVVESPGLLTTVQDLGRPGYGPLGVSAAGAADPFALQVGNLLAGNGGEFAGLEMTLTGGRFRFPDGAVIALTGSDFSPQLDGSSLALWIAHAIAPGGTVTLGGTQTGARGYLAVAGGIQVPPFLGSSSTHLVSGL